MKKIFLVLVMVAMAMNAAALGESCSSPIHLTKDPAYKETISKPQTVWYTASTFDLPLSVYFMPEKDTDPAPEVEMDFSCTTGVYTDSIICSLFCPNSGSGLQIDMPHKPKLKTDHKDGRLVYYIAMGKEYRDLLLKMGISYNVEVYVKVIFKSAGTISIAPDDMFSSCMDGAKFMKFGDSEHFKAQDMDKHIIVPYVQWQYDSIYYIWKGSAQATVTVATECNHDPTDGEDESILQRLKIPAGDSVKVPSDKIRKYVEFGEAGMLFAKCYSNAEGTLTIKKVPQAPPRGNATLLKYDQRIIIKANDTAALYAIPHSWDTATLFTTPTDHVFRMYISTEPDFLLKDAFASYTFHATDKGHWFGFYQEEMKALWEKTKEQYLYVRFACAARTTLMPEIWTPSGCMSATLIPKGTTSINVDRKDYGAKYYRFYYNEWRNGTMTFQWIPNTGNCPTYIGDTCEFNPSATAEHVIANKTIPKNSSWAFTPDELETWAGHADPDGCLYIRFNSTNGGEMIISTDAPEETDPEIPRTTVSVVCDDSSGKNITVSVSVAQHITVSGGGGVVEDWDAVPGEPKSISLDSGSYRLQGEKEELTILVP